MDGKYFVEILIIYVLVVSVVGGVIGKKFVNKVRKENEKKVREAEDGLRIRYNCWRIKGCVQQLF